MFTGIIEEIGIVLDFKRHQNGADITVEGKKVLENTHLGDSISINGCCQTVVKITPNSFTANVSNETLAVTNFKNLKPNSPVNLERALTPTSRMGGHMVQGHIDGLGKFLKSEKHSEFYDLYFEVPQDLDKYIVKKGSIAINGVSLTIADIKNSTIKVAVIPHTFENTTFKTLKVGEFVNLETDILGRYIEKFLSQKDNKNGQTSNIDENFLKENGFI